MSHERRGLSQKGMRDVATVQTRLVSSAPTNRTQAVSRYARLENERMRLQRELDAWNARRLEAERMLAKVDAELQVMRQFLLGTPAAVQTSTPSRRAAPKGREALRQPAASGALIEY